METCQKCGEPLGPSYWCVKNRIGSRGKWVKSGTKEAAGTAGVLCLECRDKFFAHMREWSRRMVDAERICSGYPWEHPEDLQ